MNRHIIVNTRFATRFLARSSRRLIFNQPSKNKLVQGILPPAFLQDYVFDIKGFGKFDRKNKLNEKLDESTREKKEENSSDKGQQKTEAKKSTGEGNNNSNDPDPRQDLLRMLMISGVILFSMTALSLLPNADKREITWQEFQSHLLESGKVDRVVISNKTTAKVYLREPVEIPRWNAQRLKPGTTFPEEVSPWKDPHLNSPQKDAPTPEKYQRYPSIGSAPGIVDNYYVFSIGNIETFEQRLEDAQRNLGIHPRDFIPVMYVNETNLTNEFLKLLPSLILMLVVMGAIAAMTGGTGVGGGGGGVGNIFRMTRSPAKRISKETVTTNFSHVAGCDEAKREIMEFVEFLKDSKKFTDLGAKIPRGAMLTGPPGTGKTLLAKATAGEANVPFFTVSGSDFVEMFVGLGASRVRELFKEARAAAPCIIFIDEIDAIGRKRGRGGMSGGNEERENTLNQLLVEMDGFDSKTNIVILAGTNRVDVLDPALLRPGRFDRTITVDKPDIEGRKGIFKVHLKSIVIDGDIETLSGRMAALTPGFVGADIANICNEAAIIAARENKKKVEMVDFEAATDRVIGGLASRKIITPEEKKVIAYHEAGHAIAGWNLEHADPLLKVTIVPRGNGALGFAQYLPKEIFLRTRDQILDIVCMALAGRASEQINFGKVTTGASDDLRRVTQIVYQMVQVYGMNDRVGQVAFPRNEGSGWPEDKMYSNATAEMMDEEVRKIVEEAYARTLSLIQGKNDQVKLVAELLLEKETITNKDVARLIGERPYSAGKEYETYVNGWNNPSPEVSKDEKTPNEEEEVVAGLATV